MFKTNKNEMHHNEDITKMTGIELITYFIKLTDKKEEWKNDRRYFIHTDKYLRPKYCFIITPNPKDQPRNAHLNFNKLPSDWIDLKETVQDKDFRSKRSDFLKNPIRSLDFTKPVTIANVLMCFEIARREENTNSYCISRQMTEDAIKIVMSPKQKDYSKQAGWLVDMFSVQPSKERLEYYNKIMDAQPPSNDADCRTRKDEDLPQEMTGLKIQDRNKSRSEKK